MIEFATVKTIAKASFMRWLETTTTPATCEDSRRCAIAQYLKDSGYKNPDVSGDSISAETSEGEVVEFKVTPWTEDIIEAFDSLDDGVLQPEVYREPLIKVMRKHGARTAAKGKKKATVQKVAAALRLLDRERVTAG